MKTVDHQALGLVNRALGLTGAGASLTEFLDGQLDQTLDVVPIVRRGRTPAGTTGIFTPVMENNHTVAETETSEMAPYQPGTAAVAPYPDLVGPGFDLWLISATVSQTGGSGTFTGALFIEYSLLNQGWGVDEAGAVFVATSIRHPVAFWDSVVTETHEFAITEAGQPRVWINERLARTTAVRLLFSSTSSAAAVFQCNLVMGMFPVSLGQDATV